MSSPSRAVVGASDLDATGEFLAALGLREAGRVRIDAKAALALYGHDRPLTVAEYGVPACKTGRITLVEAPEQAPAAGPYDHGPYDLSVYSRDISRSADIAAAAGAECGPVGSLELGTLVLNQCKAVGPDGLRIVFIESERRRSSVLDRDPERLHSEVHSIVWCVRNVEFAAKFWREEAKLAQAFDMPITDPAVSKFLGLPRPNVPIRMALLSNTDVDPIRFELLAFPKDKGAPAVTGPLRPGVHALAFDVDDVDLLVKSMPSATYSDPITVGDRRAVAGVAPAAIRFELWTR